MPALLADLGGTHLRLGIWPEAAEPQVIVRRRIRTFVDGIASRQIWHNIMTSIVEFAAGMRQQISDAAPVVISFPGPVVHGSRLVNAPTVAGASSALPDLQSIIAGRTGRTVYVLNDVSAAAWHLSRRIEARRFMVVTVSSGIGSKIFDRDHSRGVIDEVPYAGEIGHATVDETAGAPVCDCGGRGHLGAVSSGRGILRFARRTALSDASFQTSLCAQRFRATAGALSNERHLVPAAKAGDAWALRMVRQSTEPLARVLLHCVMAAGLERVAVIGGFALSLGDVYLDILRDGMAKRCDYPVLVEHLNDLLVLGDDDACLLGAAAFASRFCCP
jgi:predicted NBD/HSP70 family sugar kinase